MNTSQAKIRTQRYQSGFSHPCSWVVTTDTHLSRLSTAFWWHIRADEEPALRQLWDGVGVYEGLHGKAVAAMHPIIKQSLTALMNRPWLTTAEVNLADQLAIFMSWAELFPDAVYIVADPTEETPYNGR